MQFEPMEMIALNAVAQAARLCRAVGRPAASGSMSKEDRSPVTIADYGAQAVILHLLAQDNPDIPVVGEEDATALREEAQTAIRDQVVAHVGAILPGLTEEDVLAAIDRGAHLGGPAGVHWTLDPIDGTKGFLRGDQYAIALGLIRDGVVEFGVLGCPNLPVRADAPNGPCGCLLVARRGAGAWMRPLDEVSEPQRIHVSDVTDPALATFCESVESGHTSHGHSAQIAERLGVTVPPYRIDSQCKYAALARGNAAIYLRLPTRADYEEKIWDHAAGCILVEEAGGTVTDVDGKPLDFSIGRTLRNNKGVVATNGPVHDQVITAVQAVLGR